MYIQVVKLANNSVLWGNMMKCSHLLSGTYQHLESSVNFTVNMLCSERLTNHKEKLVEVKLSQPIATQLEVGRLKTRWIPRQIAIILHAYEHDYNLITFLNLWRKHVWNEAESINKPILNIIMSKQSKKEPVLNQVDLTQWEFRFHTLLRVYSANSEVEIKQTYKSIIKEIRQDSIADESNDVVLITTPDLRFNRDFLQRCSMLAKPNKQIYLPTFANSRRQFSTLCIYVSDLYSHIFPRSRRQYKEYGGSYSETEERLRLFTADEEMLNVNGDQSC